MRCRWKYLFSFFLLVIWAFCSHSLVDAKSLQISQYHIDAAIQQDGSVQFLEEITFEANGSYNGIYYNLDYAGVKQPTDVSVFRKEVLGNLVELSEDYTEAEGTYLLTDDENLLSFKVFEPFSDTSKTLVFKYTLPSLVTNYADTAELNRRVVGAKWEVDQANITVHISLPGAATRESLRAWGHGGDGTGNVTIDEDYRGVTFTMNHNSEGSFVETHVIFPVSLTADNTNVINENRFEAIIAQEEALLTEAENQRQIGVGLLGIGGVMGLLAVILAWLKGYRANRKRLAAVPFVPDHLFEIPQDISPAVMSSAIYKNLTMNDFGATVMDLVRKKVIRMSEHEPYTLELLPHQQKLLEHEQYALHILFVKIAKGNILELDAVNDFAEASPKRYATLMDQWQAQVEEESEPFDTMKFRDGEKAMRATGALVVAALGLLLTMVGLFLVRASLVEIITGGILALAVLGLTLGLGGFLSVRRTLGGEYEYRRWNAFRQMLLDLSSLERAEIAAIQLWDHILVYAISLGVAEQVIKVLSVQFPEIVETSTFYSTDYGWQMATYQLLLSNTFTHSYTQAVETVQSNSSNSNSGGFGGGFSGGSSFGSGGASGGGGF